MKTKLTINDLFLETLKHHWNEERYIKSGWKAEVEKLYKCHLAPFGATRIDKLSAKTIRNWHKKLIDTPFSANRALDVLSKMYSYAIEQEYIPQNTNPCAIVKSHVEKKRKRFASVDELKKIGYILAREKDINPRAVGFLYTLLFSGARPRSLERAVWSDLTEINFENEIFGVLTFNGKSSHATGEDEQIIIPPQALLLIKTFNRRTKTIFDMKMPRFLWDKVRKEAGCPDLWARDFRRTFATIGLSNGESVGIIGELLNHKNANTTKIYTQLIQTKKIETTKNIADTISQIFKS